MSEPYFTIVFYGDIRRLPFNPMAAHDSKFGKVFGSSRGSAFAEIDKLEAQNAELVETIRSARRELAALLADPREYEVGKWPIENPADAECLMNAYNMLLNAEISATVDEVMKTPALSARSLEVE